MKGNAVAVSAEEPPPASPFLRNPERLFRETAAFARAVMDEAGFTGREAAILFCGDAFIRGLNARFRGVDEPTDVLSFACDDAPGERGAFAGDIAISLETLQANCAAFGVSPNEELKRLIAHGILHLAGWNHEGHLGGALEPMLEVQEKLLQNYASVTLMEEYGGNGII